MQIYNSPRQLNLRFTTIRHCTSVRLTRLIPFTKHSHSKLTEHTGTYRHISCIYSRHSYTHICHRSNDKYGHDGNI